MSWSWMEGLYRRAVESYDETVAAYEQRLVQGVQPSTPVINLFNIQQQELVLVLGNVGYLITTAVLYRIMTRRKALQLKPVLTLYNLVNVLLSGYISVSIIQHKFSKRSQFICNRGDDGLAYVFVIFYIQKFWEFLDTYFFLLRKSFRQVTFLHLFHHASITVIVGTLLPFDYDGDMYLPILVNSLVHVLVYLHYFFTCIGIPSWWSPYLTSLQMGQFAFIFVQSSLAFLEGPTCGSPDFSKILMIGYMGSMLVLFSDFFVKRYIFKQQAYDMCGVIKSVEYTGGPVCSTFHGNAKLGAHGTAIVRMPKHFSEGISGVMYCYQLTPIHDSMPELHVAQEMTRAAVKQGGAFFFIVAGGKPHGVVSWMVCLISGDDKIRLH